MTKGVKLIHALFFTYKHGEISRKLYASLIGVPVDKLPEIFSMYKLDDPLTSDVVYCSSAELTHKGCYTLVVKLDEEVGGYPAGSYMCDIPEIKPCRSFKSLRKKFIQYVDKYEVVDQPQIIEQSELDKLPYLPRLNDTNSESNNNATPPTSETLSQMIESAFNIPLLPSKDDKEDHPINDLERIVRTQGDYPNSGKLPLPPKGRIPTNPASS